MDILYDQSTSSMILDDLWHIHSLFLSISLYINVYIMYDVGKKIEHLGIRIELIGQTEMLMDKANMKFVSMVKELESAGKHI